MPIHADGSYENRAVAHFGVSYKMVHSLSEIWSAAATPPLWLSSQLTVGKEHPLVRPAQPKAKAPPLAAHSKWHRPISKMTHYPGGRRAGSRQSQLLLENNKS